MKYIAGITIVFLLMNLSSCDKLYYGYKYNKGSLPDTPVNLTDFNTEFDDFNVGPPSLGRLIPLCFSTNRNNEGNEFDIIYLPMNINFDRNSGVLKVTSDYSDWKLMRRILKT
ncbi:MAG: hypothetical protein WBJ84_05980 [Bacteroidales bacterium]